MSPAVEVCVAGAEKRVAGSFFLWLSCSQASLERSLSRTKRLDCRSRLPGSSAPSSRCTPSSPWRPVATRPLRGPLLPSRKPEQRRPESYAPTGPYALLPESVGFMLLAFFGPAGSGEVRARVPCQVARSIQKLFPARSPVSRMSWWSFGRSFGWSVDFTFPIHS